MKKTKRKSETKNHQLLHNTKRKLVILSASQLMSLCEVYQHQLALVNSFNQPFEIAHLNKLFKGKPKGTPMWGTHHLEVLKRYHLRL